MGLLLSALLLLLAEPSSSRRPSFSRGLLMRDGSTASNYFSVGARVRVVKPVTHRPNAQSSESFLSLGKVGTVVGVWEKCEVDPHCCCAELAFEAPIEVRFNDSDYDPAKSFWTAFYAVDEIENCRDDPE